MSEDIIKQLEFRHRLNKFLKSNSFDAIFEQDDRFVSDFAEFKQTKIGKIWLSKPLGQSYIAWQNE